MSKTLFVGCSHTMGYVGNMVDNVPQPNVWQKNNYAEIYSTLYNKEVVISASAGTGNRVYPRFIAHALKQHPDIDEVIVQSTYWGRFPVAINPDLSETSIFPLDFFIDKDISSDKVQRYSIGLSQQDKYLEQYLKAMPEDYDLFPYIQDTKVWEAEPDIRRSSHLYMQMWHYSNTHLEQEDYFQTIALCDMLCTYNNIPLYVWNINDRCLMPAQTKDFFTDLKSTKFAPVDAITYIKDFTDVETVDGEHYTKTVHNYIAEKYIPYIKENSC